MTNICCKSCLKTTERMSNTGYHENNKPNWWARVGSGSTATWLAIPWVRGDRTLEVEVDVPPGTVVHCGAGKGDHKTVRATVTTTMLRPTEAASAEEWIAWHEYRLAATADKADDVAAKPTTQIGDLVAGVATTLGAVRAARRVEIERLRATLAPSTRRLALEQERAVLLARLAEIDVIITTL